MNGLVPDRPVHPALFHVHAVGGRCPVCLVANAEDWQDLYEKLETAKQIVASTMEIEAEILLSKVGRAASLSS